MRAIALADALVADTSAECLHPDGRWQRAPDDPRVDAALLLPALRGAVPATDPRSTATLAAVAAELAEDGYLYRFWHDARPLGHAEGAFTLCGFWMALAAHQQGHHIAALRKRRLDRPGRCRAERRPRRVRACLGRRWPAQLGSVGLWGSRTWHTLLTSGDRRSSGGRA